MGPHQETPGGQRLTLGTAGYTPPTGGVLPSSAVGPIYLGYFEGTPITDTPTPSAQGPWDASRDGVQRGMSLEVLLGYSEEAGGVAGLSLALGPGLVWRGPVLLSRCAPARAQVCLAGSLAASLSGSGAAPQDSS